MSEFPTASIERTDGVRLGPNLPATAYYATERWHPERIGALALYCSDGRWGEAFDEFCHRHLQIPRYDRLAVPGGPAWLVPTGEGDLLPQIACEQLDFLVRAHRLERIALITHFACAMYTERLGLEPDACLPQQIADVRLAAASLRHVYRGIQVEGYLAMRRENCLSFHVIGT